jgi:hypothetical protein
MEKIPYGANSELHNRICPRVIHSPQEHIWGKWLRRVVRAEMNEHYIQLMEIGAQASPDEHSTHQRLRRQRAHSQLPKNAMTSMDAVLAGGAKYSSECTIASDLRSPLKDFPRSTCLCEG